MITELTEAQRAEIPRYVEKWTEIGLSTEPANRPEAEKGIIQAYRIARLSPPKKIIWCNSPLSQGLTRAIIFGSKNSKIKIGASVRDSVGASVGASVWDSVRDSVGDSLYGQHDASWLGFYDFFKEVCCLEMQTEKLAGLWQISKNAGWWLPHQHICWVSERHNILRRNRNGRLNADGEMALQYPDGWGIYACDGIRLPEKYGAVKRQDWQANWLLEEKNAEIRRCLIEQIGYGKIQRDLNAKKVDSWREYELLRVDNADVEPIFLLKMTCPSTNLIHAHRVPPDIGTARQAISWINHGIDAEEFVMER